MKMARITLLTCYVTVLLMIPNTVQASERKAMYNRTEELDGLSCLSEDVILDEVSDSPTSCLVKCMGKPCETIFYNNETLTCTGCKTCYTNNTCLTPSTGIMAYTHSEPKDCRAWYANGHGESGVYRIFPVGIGTEGIQVRCDMNTSPGGWIVIQRRIDDRDFYKTWSEYKDGFGDLSGSYWLGNDLIWKLTSNKEYRLRIDLTAQDGMTGYAEYDHFSIGNETSQYKLNVGGFHGDVGDSLNYSNQLKFSTKDRKNHQWHTNCAVAFHGAWWYKDCHDSNLNGDYMNGDMGEGLNWRTWRGFYESMIATEMKIYPA